MRLSSSDGTSLVATIDAVGVRPLEDGEDVVEVAAERDLRAPVAQLRRRTDDAGDTEPELGVLLEQTVELPGLCTGADEHDGPAEPPVRTTAAQPRAVDAAGEGEQREREERPERGALDGEVGRELAGDDERDHAGEHRSACRAEPSRPRAPRTPVRGRGAGTRSRAPTTP